MIKLTLLELLFGAGSMVYWGMAIAYWSLVEINTVMGVLVLGGLAMAFLFVSLMLKYNREKKRTDEGTGLHHQGK